MRAWIVSIALISCSAKPDLAPQAERLVKKLAFEAYPQWAMTHPAKMCPDKIDELFQFATITSDKDPWGKPLKMVCGAGAPAEVKGIGIASSGPDGAFGTMDDVNSWTK